ncbi:bifunctional serine/threonine-protein kinase/ABC transporter substrate-binding protein [Polyangium sp. 6x1]|uniref:bifunctional serine/threonine-protein kinase/ABC transporter substrate-binding protein n=1 Tax=Polyangium sp. 6x1 TaxID=3042689 RepID=UPI002482DF70|nr:bifunctional serine/threonine-protein kinase/ABC transporter substrate-binding protein [Polyangium sp. 6x1]MDI1442469.1 bifunctional serine/threonine-protein kinase/ABC transporter substrate-binding protein [Polyangium sp. 6x1]
MSRPVPPIEARAAARVGTTLDGKYRILRVLGVGGMAAVYLGVHRNGHRVAIKVLHPELCVHEDVRARFVREGYVANAVGHAGAVQVLDDDVAEDGAAFLVMEMLEGESLGARLRRLGPRPCREVLVMGHKLLDVLAAAHDKGIVHRDIKPENLFLTSAGALKVLDFGIARIRHEPGSMATHAGVRLGTPAFMPPEQALGRWEQVDGRADVWASGATMFTLLTGRVVHEAETAEESIVRVATQPARSLADVTKDVPAEIVAVVDRALRFSRDDRWPNARAMQEAIEQAHAAVYGESISSASIEPALAPPAEVESPASDRLSRDGEGASSVATLDQPSVATLDPPSVAPTPLDTIPPDPSAMSTKPATPTIHPTAGDAPAPDELPPARPDRPRRRLAVGLLAMATLATLVGAWISRPAPVAQPSAPSASVAAAPRPGCADHQACVAANGGKPALCRKDDGVCVALETEDCRVLAGPGDVENEGTIWFGAMYPFRLPDPTAFGPRAANAVDLARRDFAETTGGLPPARPGGPRRPLAVVLCDDATNATRAAEHLVNEVRVPAILGFARSKEVLDLASALFLPKGVLTLAANTASALRDIPHAPGEPRLVWRVTVSGDMAVPAVRDVLAEVMEPELRRAPGLLGPGAPIRVALARVGNPSGQSIADHLVGALRINGRNVTENGSDFRMFVIPDVGDVTEEAILSRAAAEIAAYQPHVILSAGMEPNFIPSIERAWPTGARHLPRYLWDTMLVHADLLDLVQEHPEARRRMLFVDTVDENAAAAKYLARYNEVFSPPQTAGSLTSAPYDAFYLLAYATVALGDAKVTGPALARMIPRLLSPGEHLDVGPGGIYPALYALTSGRNVDLDGAQTSLDFDVETGDATADYAVWCVAPGGPGQKPRPIRSGMTFRARSRKLEGTLTCP